MIRAKYPELILTGVTLFAVCMAAMLISLLRPVNPVYDTRPPAPVSSLAMTPPAQPTSAIPPAPIGTPVIELPTMRIERPSLSTGVWIGLIAITVLATGGLAGVRWRRKKLPYTGQTAASFTQAQDHESRQANQSVIQSLVNQGLMRSTDSAFAGKSSGNQRDGAAIVQFVAAQGAAGATVAQIHASTGIPRWRIVPATLLLRRQGALRKDGETLVVNSDE